MADGKCSPSSFGSSALRAWELEFKIYGDKIANGIKQTLQIFHCVHDWNYIAVYETKKQAKK